MRGSIIGEAVGVVGITIMFTGIAIWAGVSPGPALGVAGFALTLWGSLR